MKTYTFHISLPGTGRTWRKIEMHEDQTLQELHMAIQRAFVLANNHLYSFFMNGKAWDRGSEYCLPEGYPPGYHAPPERDSNIVPFPQENETSPQQREVSSQFESLLKEMLGDVPNVVEIARSRLGDKWDDVMRYVAEPGNVLTTTLKDLRLQQNQGFLYLFDYSHSWQFKVRVHAINPNAPTDVEYPRIVESVGTPPHQRRD